MSLPPPPQAPAVTAEQTPQAPQAGARFNPAELEAKLSELHSNPHLTAALNARKSELALFRAKLKNIVNGTEAAPAQAAKDLIALIETEGKILQRVTTLHQPKLAELRMFSKKREGEARQELQACYLMVLALYAEEAKQGIVGDLKDGVIKLKNAAPELKLSEAELLKPFEDFNTVLTRHQSQELFELPKCLALDLKPSEVLVNRLQLTKPKYVCDHEQLGLEGLGQDPTHYLTLTAAIALEHQRREIQSHFETQGLKDIVVLSGIREGRADCVEAYPDIARLLANIKEVGGILKQETARLRGETQTEQNLALLNALDRFVAEKPDKPLLQAAVSDVFNEKDPIDRFYTSIKGLLKVVDVDDLAKIASLRNKLFEATKRGMNTQDDGRVILTSPVDLEALAIDPFDDPSTWREESLELIPSEIKTGRNPIDLHSMWNNLTDSLDYELRGINKMQLGQVDRIAHAVRHRINTWDTDKWFRDVTEAKQEEFALEYKRALGKNVIDGLKELGPKLHVQDVFACTLLKPPLGGPRDLIDHSRSPAYHVVAGLNKIKEDLESLFDKMSACLRKEIKKERLRWFHWQAKRETDREITTLRQDIDTIAGRLDAAMQTRSGAPLGKAIVLSYMKFDGSVLQTLFHEYVHKDHKLIIVNQIEHLLVQLDEFLNADTSLNTVQIGERISTQREALDAALATNQSRLRDLENAAMIVKQFGPHVITRDFLFTKQGEPLWRTR